eukprot:scaffold7637_cov430-Prasinococcus_capsulatus_cf.AAC.1
MERSATTTTVAGGGRWSMYDRSGRTLQACSYGVRPTSKSCLRPPASCHRFECERSTLHPSVHTNQSDEGSARQYDHSSTRRPPAVPCTWSNRKGSSPSYTDPAGHAHAARASTPTGLRIASTLGCHRGSTAARTPAAAATPALTPAAAHGASAAAVMLARRRAPCRRRLLPVLVWPCLPTRSHSRGPGLAGGTRGSPSPCEGARRARAKHGGDPARRESTSLHTVVPASTSKPALRRPPRLRPSPS